MRIGVLQWGHLDRLPAAAAGTWRLALQPGQVTANDIGASKQEERRTRHRLREPPQRGTTEQHPAGAPQHPAKLGLAAQIGKDDESDRRVRLRSAGGAA